MGSNRGGSVHPHPCATEQRVTTFPFRRGVWPRRIIDRPPTTPSGVRKIVYRDMQASLRRPVRRHDHSTTRTAPALAPAPSPNAWLSVESWKMNDCKPDIGYMWLCVM